MQCTCVGLVDNTHIIIRPPAGHSASLVNLSENVSVVVKYMDGARIFGFKSTIEHVILRPYLLIFIAPPFSAEELDLRKDIRCPCFLPMNCTLPGSTVEMYGFIVITSYSIHYTKLYEQSRPRVKKCESAVARTTSRASLSGARHFWFQPGWSPVLQPQSERQRSTPCTQLQEEVSCSRARRVGGLSARKAAKLVSFQPSRPESYNFV